MLNRFVTPVPAPAFRIHQRRRLLTTQEDEPVLVEEDGAKYVVVFDPLDGSSNIDASIPTGARVIVPEALLGNLARRGVGRTLVVIATTNFCDLPEHPSSIMSVCESSSLRDVCTNCCTRYVFFSFFFSPCHYP